MGHESEPRTEHLPCCSTVAVTRKWGHVRESGGFINRSLVLINKRCSVADSTTISVITTPFLPSSPSPSSWNWSILLKELSHIPVRCTCLGSGARQVPSHCSSNTYWWINGLFVFPDTVILTKGQTGILFYKLGYNILAIKLAISQVLASQDPQNPSL